jgi:hypothetical protein
MATVGTRPAIAQNRRNRRRVSLVWCASKTEMTESWPSPPPRTRRDPKCSSSSSAPPIARRCRASCDSTAKATDGRRSFSSAATCSTREALGRVVGDQGFLEGFGLAVQLVDELAIPPWIVAGHVEFVDKVLDALEPDAERLGKERRGHPPILWPLPKVIHGTFVISTAVICFY